MKRVVIYGVLGFFLFIDYGKSADDTESTTQQIAGQARCVGVLQNSMDRLDLMDPFDRMLFQVEEILNKVQITQKNRDAVRRVQSVISHWKSVRDKQKRWQSFGVRAILEISYFLRVPPSILLSSGNLASHINFEDLSLRPSLPELNMGAILRLINQNFRKEVADMQSDFSDDLGVPVTLSILADLVGLSKTAISDTFNSNVLSNYLEFAQVLNANTGVIEFFKEVEASPEFNKNFNIDTSKITENRQALTLEEHQFLENIGRHIISAMNQRGIKSVGSIKNLSGLKKSELGQRNFYFSSVVRAKYVTRYPIASIINGDLREDISHLPVRTEKNEDWNDYIDKAKKVLIYLMKHQMVKEGLSIETLAQKSRLQGSIIRRFLKTDSDLRILTLLKIVEDGFDIPLADFLAGQNSTGLSFEEAIEQFDSLNFDIEIPKIKQSDTVNNYLSHIIGQLKKAVDTLKASGLSTIRIERLTNSSIRAYLEEEVSLQNNNVTIQISLKIAHIFNLSLLELLFHEDISSLRPINLRPLSEGAVQNALYALSRNIQVEMINDDISLYDLQVQTGVRLLSDLEPVLNGEITATYYRLAQVCRVLLRHGEDPFTPFQRVLKEVSTVSMDQMFHEVNKPLPALYDSTVPIDQVFHQLEEILNKVQITSNNEEIVRKMQSLIRIHKSIKNKEERQSNVRIRTLLQISYFLNVPPSILLTSGNLASHVSLEDLSLRSSLPEPNMRALLILINRHFREKITNIRSRLSSRLDTPVTLQMLSENVGVSESSISRALHSNLLPNYLEFAQVLSTSTGIIEFFKKIEASPEFEENFNVKPSQITTNGQTLTVEELQFLSSTGQHIVSAMNQRGIRKVDLIRYLTGLQISELGQRNFNFSAVVRAGYVTRYSIASIISGEDLHENKPELSVRTEKNEDWNDHIEKAKRVLIYLIKYEMIERRLTIQELAQKSRLYEPTVQNVLEKRSGDLKILTLLKIVADGLGIPLADFLADQNSTGLSFESAIEQFDSLNLDIEVQKHEQDDIIENHLNHIRNRIAETRDVLIASGLSRSKVEGLTNSNFKTYFIEGKWPQDNYIRLQILLRIAHIFNLSLLEFLFHEDISSLQPVNLERLSNDAVQNALNTLSENIQAEMITASMSLSDLKVQTGVRLLADLERVLNGEVTATYYRLAQICGALLKSDEEDPFAILQDLLRGVSTVSSHQVLAPTGS